jgi:PKD repeat protein
MRIKLLLRKLKVFSAGMAVLLLGAANPAFSQTQAPTYCNPTVANMANYQMGMTNVTIGSGINNSSTAQNGSNPVYWDYTNQVEKTTAGSTINFSITLGNSNSTQFRIYVDWDKNGVFNTSNETMHTSTVYTAGSTQTGSFAVPGGQAPGVYRMRVSGTLGGNNPDPCSNMYGEFEDYTLIVMQPSAGVDAIAFRITPTSFTPGTHSISLNWYNISSATITTADLGYSLNGGTAVTQSWSGSVASGANTTFAFTTPISVPAGNSILKVWVRNPNSTDPDQGPGNDTIIFNFCTALSGNFTIDPAGSGPNNFTSFGAATSKLMSCGIGGPVVFSVAAGTYSEQVSLGAVNGVSSTNTITFDGGAGNAATRIITYAATGNPNAHTFMLDNSPYVRIRNLTIRNSGATYGCGIHLKGLSSYAIISNNIIEFVGGGMTTTSTANYKGININNSPDVSNASQCGGTGVGITNLLIDSNVINGGSFGIIMIGSSASLLNTISNNLILNSYWMGISFSNNNGWFAINNTITMRANGQAGSIGIGHCNGSTSGTTRYEAIGNKITNAGGYGIYYLSGNVNGARCKVINNLIGGGFRSATCYGISLTERNFDIWHNSIHFDNATASTAAGIYMGGGASYIGHDIRNNNIALTHPSSLGLCMRIAVFGTLAKSEFNNFYKANSASKDIVDLTAVLYTPANLKGAEGLNSVFFSQPPGFMSNLNLHLDPTVAPMYGDRTLGVTFDTDGEPRCPEAPTVGGDESKYPFPVPTANFTKPDTIYANNATDFLNNTSATAPYSHKWYVDGVLKASTVDMLYSFPATGTYLVKLVTGACGARDSITDTITVINPVLAPIAYMSASQNVVNVSQSVKMRDLSKNGPTSWAWDISPKTYYNASLGQYDPAYFFLNGTDSTSQNPEISFIAEGPYTICLTATNSFGSSTICNVRYIIVRPNITMCSITGTASVTNANFGVLTDDGGAGGNYTANKNCNYLITPCSPNLGMVLKSFNLNTGDFLRVYDGSSNLAPRLWNSIAFPNGWTGNKAINTNIPDSIKSTSGQLYVEFVSDPATGTLGPGFVAEWFAQPYSFVPPVAGFELPDTVCESIDYTFVNTSTGYGNKYYWDFDGDGLTDDDVANPVYNFSFAGVYDVRLVVENCGGWDTITKTITVVAPTTAPVVGFYADIRTPAVGTDIVSFTDTTFTCVDSWQWTFSPNTVTYLNGTNASSRNPQVRFNSAGCYTVRLISGYYAAFDSSVQTCYIKAVNYCNPPISSLTQDIGISNVEIGSINNSTSIGSVPYTDFTLTHSTNIAKGVLTNISVQRITSYNSMDVKVWIDLNQDGDFDDMLEEVAHDPFVTGTSWNGSFTLPLSVMTGGTRMRIGTNISGLPNLACGTNKHGEFEDYRVFIISDVTRPVITMLGTDTVNIEAGYTYVDSGATANDNIDGNITVKIITASNVNTSTVGAYAVTYNVTDASGNPAIERIRVVNVTPDKTPGIITLLGSDTVYVEVFDSYTDDGATAVDMPWNVNLTPGLNVSSTVDTAVLGTYLVTFTVTDAAGNIATLDRVVIVRDTEKPVVTLVGNAIDTIDVYSSYTELGATATDNYWSNLTNGMTGFVDTAQVGTYTLTYYSIDGSGNKDSVIRTVVVMDREKPVITLIDNDTLVVEAGVLFVDPGTVVSDNYCPNLVTNRTGSIPDVCVPGFYTFSYDVTDCNGNAAITVNRTIKVVDTRAPGITLNGADTIKLYRWEYYVDAKYTATDNCAPLNALVIDTLGNYPNSTSLEGTYYRQYSATDPHGNTAFTKTRVIIVNGLNPNSVREVVGGMGTLNIYPNPAKAEINIAVELNRTENMSISISNMLGQEILTVHNGELLTGSFRVNVEDLSNGVYYVKFNTAAQTATRKIVVSK